MLDLSRHFKMYLIWKPYLDKISDINSSIRIHV